MKFNFTMLSCHEGKQEEEISEDQSSLEINSPCRPSYPNRANYSAKEGLTNDVGLSVPDYENKPSNLYNLKLVIDASKDNCKTLSISGEIFHVFVSNL